MNRNEKTALVVLLVLLLLGLLLWRWRTGSSVNTPPAAPIAVSTAPVVPMPALPPPKTSKTSAKTAPVTTSANGAPVPPKLELHKELIPKNIEIVRCYYTQEIAPPGTTIDFDINGSGFTSEFAKMIRVESGHDHVDIKDLHLVTANQLHGSLVVGSDAKTGFVYPRVLIHDLPVFRAPDPFAVVRKGEVLTVFFVSMEENGRGGNFRVITNLDEALAQTFRIEPSTHGIEVSEIRPQLPYVMNGHLQIGPGVLPGDHGLTIYIDNKEAFRRTGMIRIVRPNIGQLGFIQNLTAAEKYHRPGDTVQIYVQGTGISGQDVAGLVAKVDEYDVGQPTFTYLSPLQLRLSFEAPAAMPVGIYSVHISNKSGMDLFDKKELFQIVPANWVAGVQVSPPVKAGGQSTLKVMGRDFSDAFVSAIKIETDEPGITVGSLTRIDAKTLSTTISVTDKVAPGDYWLHLSSNGQKISPPFGSIIKVEAP